MKRNWSVYVYDWQSKKNKNVVSLRFDIMGTTLLHHYVPQKFDHMSRFRIIALTGLLLSVKSVTSKSNQLPLLAKSFSTSTAMEQSILDAIGKISLSPIEKGALKDTTKIDAGNKMFLKPRFRTSTRNHLCLTACYLYILRRLSVGSRTCSHLCRQETRVSFMPWRGTRLVHTLSFPRPKSAVELIDVLHYSGISTRFKNGDFRGASLFGKHRRSFKIFIQHLLTAFNLCSNKQALSKNLRHLKELPLMKFWVWMSSTRNISTIILSSLITTKLFTQS